MPTDQIKKNVGIKNINHIIRVYRYGVRVLFVGIVYSSCDHELFALWIRVDNNNILLSQQSFNNIYFLDITTVMVMVPHIYTIHTNRNLISCRYLTFSICIREYTYNINIKYFNRLLIWSKLRRHYNIAIGLDVILLIVIGLLVLKLSHEYYYIVNLCLTHSRYHVI